MRERDSFNEINITPLTDIFLVLLIIMMVIAPLLDQQGLNLAVPEMVKQKDIKESKTINVEVTDTDTYIMDGSEISVADLPQALASKINSLPDGLLIQSNPDASHGAVVKLMDIARNSGIKSVSVVGL